MMDYQDKIVELYQKYSKEISLSFEELKGKSLKITHDDKLLLIESSDGLVLYCYYNIKGFTPFDFRFYQTIYLKKSVYEQIHFEKNAKYLYSKSIVIKDNIEFVRLDHIKRTLSETKEEFYSLLDEISQTKQKRKLLLHSCCGPCSSYCLELLHQYFDITIYYSNSNIDTLEEFNKRVETQKEIIKKLGYDIKLVVDEYNQSDYEEAIKGLESLGEFSSRCYNCYKFRMEKAFMYATCNDFEFVSTTLSISPYKNSNWINEIGIAFQNKYNISFLYSNFKLNDGYKKSIELSKKYNLYRQDYCGCKYSKDGE